jgi:hypothetical protein
MVQFWTHKEVIIVHYCVLQFAYRAVVIAQDFDAMEVCCKTVVTRVEPEICNCLFSGFIFVVFPRGFDVLPLCLGPAKCFGDNSLKKLLCLTGTTASKAGKTAGR